MNAYREHIAPHEPIDEYFARIEREKLVRATRDRPKAPPTPLPAVPANALAMAPMGVVFA